MAETIKLQFDDGYKNIEFNGDPNKVLRINPTDAKFLERMANFNDTADDIKTKYGDIDLEAITKIQDIDENNPDMEELKSAAKSAEQLDNAMKELINSIFGYDISKIIFGNDSCLTPANGQPVFINFMQCIFAYIKEVSEAEAEKSKIKLDEYKSQREMITGTSK